MDKLTTFINEQLSQESSVELPFKAGEQIVWVNDYGVVFQGNVIIGFSDDESRPNCNVFLNTSAYWFGHNSATIYKVGDLKPFIRAYSPEFGYIGLDEYKDFTWVNDPADAELFTTKAMGEEAEKGFIVDGETVQCKLVPAQGCKVHA